MVEQILWQEIFHLIFVFLYQAQMAKQEIMETGYQLKMKTTGMFSLPTDWDI